MNWTNDDEATLAILLRRKEQAQQQRRARLEEVAEAIKNVENVLRSKRAIGILIKPDLYGENSAAYVNRVLGDFHADSPPRRP